MSLISNVVFERNPPANLRKSNFFHFVCQLFDVSNRALKINEAKCVDFIDNMKGTAVLRNGVKYKLKVQTEQGLQVEEFLHVLIVDSESQQIVPFQGQDRNPSMCRVLLTHESICSRCAAMKSCGNKNDTPADPVIYNDSFLKVFLKCNQNCLINAGNPRELRKFQLAISGSSDLSSDLWSLSSHMFVHNNSKHGRVVKRNIDTSSDPSISFIWPQPGPPCGGRALIVGKNFTEETHVLFGTASLHCKLITSDAIQVEVPPASHPVVMVTLIHKNQLFQQGWHYSYAQENDNVSISPLNIASSPQSRVTKPVPFSQYQMTPTSHVTTFSSMLGLERANSPTYPPPPLKPIAVSHTANDAEEPDIQHAKNDNGFRFSREESAFNKVKRYANSVEKNFKAPEDSAFSRVNKPAGDETEAVSAEEELPTVKPT